MQVEYKFRHCAASDELKAYVSDHISKLSKFELKPMHFIVTFSAEKTALRVDVHVRGKDVEMHAHSDGNDFFSAVDLVIEKIGRQLARQKEKVQSHTGPGTPKVS